MKVSDYIRDFLIFKDINFVFGMSGANIEDQFISIFKKQNPKIILVKNEYNASTMALGHYVTTKKMAVVLTTSGPGTLNTLPVLAEAYTSRIPFVLISGIVPRSTEGFGFFQDTSGKGGSLDIMAMLKPCTCFQIKIQDESEIPDALTKVFSYALINKQPAVILIPKDLFKKEIQEFSTDHMLVPQKIERPTDLSRAMAFLNEMVLSQKSIAPLIILGEDLIHLRDIQSIFEFIFKLGAKVALTPNSKGLFDHTHTSFLGVIGIMGHKEVTDYLNQTENLVLIGVQFDFLNRLGLEEIVSHKNIMILKEQKSESFFQLESRNMCEVYGDINDNISRILLLLNPFKSFSENRERLSSVEDYSDYNFKNIINTIQSTVDDDANVFVDAGNSGAFVIHHLKTKGHGHCFISLGMGGMGNSIGAGIGGAIASSKKSYVFLGDGSFLMYGLEIHTALQYKVPIVFFIFNNNSHGMCSSREALFFEEETGMNNFCPSHFSHGLRQMFPGMICHEINNHEDLRQSLVDIKESQSPCVITINLSNNNEIPPFKTFVKK